MSFSFRSLTCYLRIYIFNYTFITSDVVIKLDFMSFFLLWRKSVANNVSMYSAVENCGLGSCKRGTSCMKKLLSCQDRGRAGALVSVLHSETQKDACEGLP